MPRLITDMQAKEFLEDPANKEVLTKVLLFHVAPGLVPPRLWGFSPSYGIKEPWNIFFTKYPAGV